MSCTTDAIAFVHTANKDRDLQEALDRLRPREWASLFALAADYGYDLDLESFFHGCLSDEIVYICPALVRFAGHLHTYKM